MSRVVEGEGAGGVKLAILTESSTNTTPEFSIDVSNLRRRSGFRACFVRHCISQVNAGASKLRDDVDLAGRLYEFIESDEGQDTVKARCDRKNTW